MSNEPVLGHGSGHTSPDWIVVDDHHVQLRAEREGNGSGRIYTITITCTDSGGNSSEEQVEVTVPHDRGRR
jgi:dTDP-D-glucose 4,6-dehydratase